MPTPKKRIRHRVRATLRRDVQFIVYVTDADYKRIAHAVQKLDTARSFSDGVRHLLLAKLDEVETNEAR